MGADCAPAVAPRARSARGVCRMRFPSPLHPLCCLHLGPRTENVHLITVLLNSENLCFDSTVELWRERHNTKLCPWLGAAWDNNSAARGRQACAAATDRTPRAARAARARARRWRVPEGVLRATAPDGKVSRAAAVLAPCGAPTHRRGIERACAHAPSLVSRARLSTAARAPPRRGGGERRLARATPAAPPGRVWRSDPALAAQKPVLTACARAARDCRTRGAVARYLPLLSLCLPSPTQLRVPPRIFLIQRTGFLNSAVGPPPTGGAHP